MRKIKRLWNIRRLIKKSSRNESKDIYFETVKSVIEENMAASTGKMGIDYTYESGNSKADIYVDGMLYESPTVTFDYDFSQRHIQVVSDACTVTKEIKVVFDTKEQTEGFYGMGFSWE